MIDEKTRKRLFEKLQAMERRADLQGGRWETEFSGALKVICVLGLDIDYQEYIEEERRKGGLENGA